MFAGAVVPVECRVALSAPLRKEAFAEGDSVALVSYRAVVTV